MHPIDQVRVQLRSSFFILLGRVAYSLSKEHVALSWLAAKIAQYLKGTSKNDALT
jgi:hypothetical protein